LESFLELNLNQIEIVLKIPPKAIKTMGAKFSLCDYYSRVVKKDVEK
jgi:hypothetical protein